MNHSGDGAGRLRAPRVAEIVADTLRARILSGQVRDGDIFPKQEDFSQEFGVSMPSVREAFRILETEGLLRVRRGNMGGSVVHVPSRDTVAYMLALVLEAQGVDLGDLGSALREMEPAAVALCAARTDRAETVMPKLREAHARLGHALETGDSLGTITASRALHGLFVDLCGNETTRVLVHTLEVLWSAHEKAWGEEAERTGGFPDPETRRQSWEEHAEIIDLIEAGDVDAVAAAARRHLASSQQFSLQESPPRVKAQTVRSHTGT